MSKKTAKTIKTPILYRMYDGGVLIREDTKDTRIVDLSFSSETAVDRWFGKEILDHNQKSVRMNFLNSGRAPLLKDHYTDKQTGVIKSAKIGSDSVGRASVRFGKSSAAEEEFNDVIDGIRQNVSVGYRIHKMVLESQSEKDGDVYRATDWEPLEISIVSIPADASVGVGRSADEMKFDTKIIETREVKTMTPEEIAAKEKADADAAKRAAASTSTVTVSDPIVDLDKIRKEEAKKERDRGADIRTIGEAHGYEKEAREAIEKGQSVEQFRAQVLDLLAARGLKPVEDTDPRIGMNDRDMKKYSLMRLIRYLADKSDPVLRDQAGFELECSAATAKKLRKEPNGAYMPFDVLMSRDINTTDDASLIGTDHLAGSFIDVLRNRTRVVEAGARLLPGLVGNVSIPKKTGASTMYWVAEGITTNPTESEATYAAVTLSPKTAGTYTEITRQMMNQSSPAIDQLTKDDLAGTMGVGLDAAALHGTGSNNQPTGIAATSGIGSVVGGTNGAAPDNADIVGLETAVAVDNADLGALAYMVNAQTRGKLKNTLITVTYGDRMVWNTDAPDTPLNGYRTLVTNQVSSTLTKGSSTSVCSAIFFGNWNDLLIGMWGTLDILVDPYTYSKSGGILVRALQDIDIAVRHAESFAAMLDALSA